jgi:hypothetical protein
MDAYIQDDFLRGYIEAAIWTGTDESDDTGGRPLDERFGFSDVALESLEKALAECRSFQEENAADLGVFREFYPRSPDGDSFDSFAGHNFWLTRCGHGTGFWDRGLPKDVGERLSEASQKAGERYIYIGDDGQLYIE